MHLLEATRQGFPYEGRSLYSMVYAVVEETGITLIDSGFPTFADRILEELDRLGGGLPLQQILLTHADLDHIGNAYDLQRATGCKVYISERELPYMTGARRRFGIKQDMYDACARPAPELEVYPDPFPGDFTVIPTPGHSAGHVCVLYKDILFAGDLCSYVDNRFAGPNPLYTEDLETAERSLRLIGGYPFKLLCPAHGMPAERGVYEGRAADGNGRGTA